MMDVVRLEGFTIRLTRQAEPALSTTQKSPCWHCIELGIELAQHAADERGGIRPAIQPHRESRCRLAAGAAERFFGYNYWLPANP